MSDWDKRREYYRNYYIKNKERIQTKNEKYYQENREKILKYNKEYYRKRKNEEN